MSSWFKKNLGDAMLAQQSLDTVHALFLSEYTKPDSTANRAVFVRHESEGHLHCEVHVYFTPAAAALALAMHATTCARPSPDGMDLLAGSSQAWSLFAVGYND